MDRDDLWRKRVAEWRASGLGPTDYCRGKGFTPSGLRYWVKRFEGASAGGSVGKALPLARVVRPGARTTIAAGARGDGGKSPPVPLVVEALAMRVQLPGGLDATQIESLFVALGRAAKGEAS